MCVYGNGIYGTWYLALEMTLDLPCSTFIDRWFGEPIKSLIIPTSIFQTDQNGLPVLSTIHRSCVRKFFSVRAYLYIYSIVYEYQSFLMLLVCFS